MPQEIEPVRWGVLGASRFAKLATIPSMQRGELSEVVGVASRSLEKAAALTQQLGLAKAYASYQELLDDPLIEAVYIPLPNHLHVEWAVKALRAGKHVLCEKPIALSTEQAHGLHQVQLETQLLCAEAFMVRHHPQWDKVVELLAAGSIGELRAIQTAFSYSNTDPANIRNQRDAGGGALYDIGVYAINTARLAFGKEPVRVAAASQMDERFGCDRLSSALLDFGTGHATFVVGTQHVRHQRVHLFGTEGHLDIEVPFNAQNNRPCRIWLDTGSVGNPDFTVAETGSSRATLIEIPTVNQYTLQADSFSLAIREGRAVKNDLVDSLRNMQVVDALFRAAESGRFEPVR